MKISVDISVGEFLDKYTILQLKHENKLNVKNELEQYEEKAMKFADYSFCHFCNTLYSINKTLFEIEDLRRLDISVKKKLELEKLCIYYNNLRYKVKTDINIHYNSDIKEIKTDSWND